MPELIHVEDHEFIYVGGFPRTHTIVVGEDSVLDEDTHFLIVYPTRNQCITVYKDKLLQYAITCRTQEPVEETAVQKVVRELREQENKRTGVTGPKVAGPTPARPA